MPGYFLELLHPTRPDFIATMTPEESATVTRHFLYLKELRDAGTLLLAGPTHATPPFGVALVKAETLEEAALILGADPAVQAGVFKNEIHPFTLSLWRDTAPATPADTSARAIRREVEVPAPLDKVWHLWTTREGLREFAVDDARVELRTGGPYEWYFSMQAPEGRRGTEGCRVLSFLPRKMLSFEWNAPPTFPEIRNGPHTFVVIEFETLDARRTRVRLTHLGWGDGGDWDKVFQYFENAWPQVLGALKQHLDNPPK